MNERLNRFRVRLSEQGLDAMIVAQPDNRRYLSGYGAADDSPASPAAWLLISETEAVLITAFTNLDWAKSEVVDFEVAKLSGTYATTAAGLLGDKSRQRIGFESRYIPVAFYQELVDVLDSEQELVPTDGIVEELREVKDEREIGLISEAVAIADEALTTIMARLSVGQTEEEIAWDLEKYMREHGANGIAFDLIVASGPNSALPHSRASARPIRMGEPLLIDMGARVDGYCSDITRTFVVGQPDARFDEVYGIVLKAHQAAIESIRPGMDGREVDAIARQVIAEAGYGEAFGHSLGHGVGLAVHERPYLSKTSDSVLAENMVVTVEPGIYIPDWGGVRIEDTVLVTRDGVEILTKATKANRIVRNSERNIV